MTWLILGVHTKKSSVLTDQKVYTFISRNIKTGGQLVDARRTAIAIATRGKALGPSGLVSISMFDGVILRHIVYAGWTFDGPVKVEVT